MRLRMMNVSPKYWSIQTKLTAGFCLVLFVSTGIITYWFYNKSIVEIHEKISQSTQKTVAQANKNIDFYLQDMERLSLSVFSDAVVQRVLRDPGQDDLKAKQDEKEMELRLLNLSMVWPDVVGIYIYGLDGRIYYQTKGTSPSLNYRLEQEPWYGTVRENKEEKLFLIPTSWETHNDSHQYRVFSLVRRISDTTFPQALGYMKIDSDLAALKNIVSSMQADEIGRVLIVSADRRMVYDSANNGPMAAEEADPALLDKVLQDKQGQFTGVWDNQEQLVVFHRSAYSDWTVAALLPTSALNREYKKARDSALLFAAAMLVPANLVSYAISVHITRRIRKLKRLMHKAEQGQFNLSVNDRSFDEVGDLTRSFDKMLKSIDAMIRQVFALQLKENEAQIQALQAQINPHFLYNTLNTMKGISNHYGVSEVARMAEVLSDMFRYSIKRDDGYVTLKEELDQVKRYLYIQSVRFDYQFAVDIDVPEALLSARIIKQTLQPIVENAVYHGLEQMVEGGKIAIHASLDDNTIVIRISDNGVGIPPEQLPAIRAGLLDPAMEVQAGTVGGTGLGMMNVHHRLRLRFGPHSGLTVESTKDNGTTVSLSMPYLTAAEDEGGESGNEGARSRG